MAVLALLLFFIYTGHQQNCFQPSLVFCTAMRRFWWFSNTVRPLLQFFPFFQWKLISLRFNYWMMSLVSFGIKSCGKLLIWWNASLERWLILRAREGHKFSCSNYLNENCQRPISAVRKMANHFMSPPRSKVAVSSHEEGRKKGIKEKATFSTLLRFFFLP